MPTCSFLISTYNWPGALALCLASVMKQSVMPDEIIICDDGSKDETRQLIKQFSLTSAVPIIHVWQPDVGFQLARVRNMGFAASRFEYIVQVDGDLIFHKDFLKDHLAFSKLGFFTTGSRVLISQQLTEKMLETQIPIVHNFSLQNSNFFNRIHLPFLHNAIARKYKTKGKSKYYVKGCNMAFWKTDLINVNGYNEDFTGWGREDSELAIRLINNNVNKRFLKFGGICYHLNHNLSSREMEPINVAMMERSEREKIKRTENGLDKFL